jgi:hypothetical protein
MRREFVALNRLVRNFHRLRLSAVAFAAVVLFYSSLQAAVAADPGTGATGAKATADNSATQKFGGIGWGIGLSADFDLTGTRVNSATVVNNIVRVTDSSNNVNVGFVLEAHYFFKAWETSRCKGAKKDNMVDALSCTDFATGPFVAIEIGGGSNATPNSGPITGYALGWMIGMRHPDLAMTSPNSSWNFGIGLRVDPKSQVLGDGIVANQPLPIGESATAIRFKTEPRVGVILLSSFSF